MYIVYHQQLAVVKLISSGNPAKLVFAYCGLAISPPPSYTSRKMSIKPPVTTTEPSTELPQPGVERRGRGYGRPFGSGNVGRPKGSKNKATTEASGWALPLVPEVLRRRLKHRRSCDAAKDCAMCRHYNDMVLHYAYGKPPQRQELVMAGIKSDTQALAKSMGLDETQTKAAVAEAERHYAALKAPQ